MTPEESKVVTGLATLGAAGLIAGLGALLASKEVLTPRIVIGRALSSISLGMVSTGILFFFPDASLYQQVGLACGLASLGTSVLEKMIQSRFGKS